MPNKHNKAENDLIFWAVMAEHWRENPEPCVYCGKINPFPDNPDCIDCVNEHDPHRSRREAWEGSCIEADRAYNEREYEGRWPNNGRAPWDWSESE